MNEAIQSPAAMDEAAAQRLTSWLSSEVGSPQAIEIARSGVGKGTANVLYKLSWGGQAFALRHAPADRITASAGNVVREGKLLRALAGTDVPHAGFVALCEDPAVLGTPFLVMEWLDGYVPADPLPDLYNDPEARNQIGPQLVSGLAKLAMTDWRGVGLDGFGKPDGFLSRQVERWLWQWESYRVRDLPQMDIVADWLRDNQPADGPIGIMHGDFSTFNVMFGLETPPRLRAILDWDTATIGEVLLDLGHLLARWDEPGEDPTTLGSSDIQDRQGLSRRGDLLALYQQETGFEIVDIRYYEVLSLFKLGCIMEGQYAQHAKDPVAHPIGPYTNIGPGLISDALRIARGEIHR